LIASLFSTSVAGQTTDVSELALATLGIDVSVLSSGDAVYSASFLSERTVLSDIAEGEAAVGVVVRIVVGSLDRLFAGLGRNALALLGLVFSGGLETRAWLSASSSWNIGRGSSAASGDFDGGFSGDWDGPRGSSDWSGCRSGGRLLDDDWFLSNGLLFFRLKKEGLLFLLKWGKKIIFHFVIS
jgi:hypothetical protein